MTGLGLGLGLGLGANVGESTWQNFTAPSGFTSVWDYTSYFTIYENGRSYRSNYNYSQYANPAGTTVYVDPINGLDTNSGLTSALAKKTINSALAVSGVSKVILAAGLYTIYDLGWVTNPTPTFTRDMAFICESGQAKLTTAHRASQYSWSQNGTHSQIYQTAFGVAPTQVVDATNTDDEGYGINLKELAFDTDLATTLSNLAANPGYYYWASSVLYVHTFDTRAPTSGVANDIMAFLNYECMTIRGNYKSYFENISFQGALSPLNYNITNGTDAALVAVNCEVLYANSGFYIDDIDFAAFKNCTAKYCKLDGFAEHAASFGTQVHALYENCRATYCGLDTIFGVEGDDFDNNANAFSAHEGAYVIRLNCYGDKTDGPIFQDISASQTLWLGCTALEAQSTQQGGTVDVAFKASDSGTNVWMKNCRSGDSYYGRMNVGATLIDIGGYVDGSQNGDSGVIL